MKNVKKRLSVVLLPKFFKRLDENWVEIRRISASSISKSIVVEEALKAAFTDFDLKKEQSVFWKNIIKPKKIDLLKKEEGTGFYLSPQTIEAAHKNLQYFKISFPNLHITMQKIIEEALNLSFNEFELGKEKSQFYLNIWNLEETQNSIETRKIYSGPRRKKIRCKPSQDFFELFQEQLEEIQKVCSSKIKRSSIAEAAIKYSIDDFNNRKKNSYLFTSLINKTENTNKKYISFSLSIDLLKIFEKNWLEIRQMLNKNIPFIHLIEESIYIAMKDFKFRREKSQIYKILCSAQKEFF